MELSETDKQDLRELWNLWLADNLQTIAAAVVDEIERRQESPRIPGLSELDAFIAGTVSDIWRDQGKRPATTQAVAVRMGYSRQHALQLCKTARDNGAIVEVPGRGSRCSGKWVPRAA